MAVAHPLVLLPIVVVASFGLWRGWGVLGVWRIVVIIRNRMIPVDFGCFVGRCIMMYGSMILARSVRTLGRYVDTVDTILPS